MERGALFRHFCVSKVITTALAHESGVIFHFFQELSNKQKSKAPRPKMTKIASGGSFRIRVWVGGGGRGRVMVGVIVWGEKCFRRSETFDFGWSLSFAVIKIMDFVHCIICFIIAIAKWKRTTLWATRAARKNDPNEKRRLAYPTQLTKQLGLYIS